MSSSLVKPYQANIARAAMFVAAMLTWSYLTSAQAQPPPPGQFDVLVITRDPAFPNIELGGQVWAGNPPGYGQGQTAPRTFRLPAGENDFYFMTPTKVSPAGCDYLPEAESMRVTVNQSKPQVGLYKCPEDDTPGACIKPPDSAEALAKMVNEKLDQYHTALQSYGAKDFRTTQTRHEFICYQREQSRRAKQVRR